MPCWITSYRVDGHEYGSSFWSTRAQVSSVCERRGLGEVLLSPHPWANGGGDCRVSTELRRLVAPRVRKRPKPEDVVHGLTWLLNLWCSSQCGPATQATNDRGWFHEAVHLIAFGREGYVGSCGRHWERVIDDVRKAEVAVPGYLPSRADLGRMSARMAKAWV